MKSILITVAALALVLATSNAAAQTQVIPDEEFAGAGDADVVGWNPSLAVNGTLNLVDNTNVVGQVEGLSMLFGLGLKGGADHVNGPAVWRNELTIGESFAKTPVVDKFIKTSDEITLASTYNYFLTKTMGGFGRVKAATSLFSARAVTADPVDYIIKSSEVGGADRTATDDNLKVASAFKPFTLTESVGGFAAPINQKNFNLNIRGGLGGRHTIASGVLVQNDDDATPEIELQELANVHQAGLEFFAGIDGKAKNDRLSYSIGAGLLVPFINNDDFDRSATSLTRLAIEATATVSVFDWMGLVYKGSIVRDPQLFPDGEELTQYQNSLLLTFQYTLIDRKKGLAEMKEAAALDQAKKDKEAAEKKATEAEERAKALELELEEAKKANSVGPSPVGPSPDGTAPDGTAPDGTTPDGTAPDGTAPDGTATPNGTSTQPSPGTTP